MLHLLNCNRIRDTTETSAFFPIAVFCDPDTLVCNDCVPIATLSIPKTLLDSCNVTQCRISSGRSEANAPLPTPVLAYPLFVSKFLVQ
jgi:hypothetical protein